MDISKQGSQIKRKADVRRDEAEQLKRKFLEERASKKMARSVVSTSVPCTSREQISDSVAPLTAPNTSKEPNSEPVAPLTANSETSYEQFSEPVAPLTANSETSYEQVAPLTALSTAAPINARQPPQSLTCNSIDSLPYNDHDYAGNLINDSEYTESLIDDSEYNESLNIDGTIRMDVADRQAFSREQRVKRKFWHKGFQNEAQFYRLGPMKDMCKFCKAMFFPEEKSGRKQYWNVQKNQLEYSYTSCCHHGILQATMSKFVGNFPPQLEHFFMPGDRKYTLFMNFVRKINSSYALASLQCTRFNFPSRGPYCFKISGSVYHKINIHGMAQEDEKATNGQLYLLDTDECLDLRQRTMDIPAEIMPYLQEFEEYIRASNPFAQSYKMMKEVYDEEEAKCASQGIEMPEVRMVFKPPMDFDKKKYNSQGYFNPCLYRRDAS